MTLKKITLIIYLLCTSVISTSYAATAYTLPADLGSNPFNCTGSGPVYDCSSSISLDKDVSITLSADVTLNISGNFDAKKNLVILANGYTLNLNVSGDVSLDKDTDFTGNITAGGDVSIDKNLKFTGDINATGNISIDKDGIVSGNLTAGGNISLDNNAVVYGVCSPNQPQCTGSSASCGAINQANAGYGGGSIKIEDSATNNGNDMTNGTYSGSAALGIGAVTPTTGNSVSLPATDPVLLPPNISSNKYTMSNNETINASSDVYYQELTIKNSNTGNLTGGGPFHIGKLKVEGSATLNLEAGIYYVDEFEIKNNATLNITSEPVIFYVGKKFKMKDDSIVAGTSITGLQVYMLSGSVEAKFEKNSVFTGMVYAPYGAKIEAKDDATLNAQLITSGELKLKNNAALTFSAADATAVSSVSTCRLFAKPLAEWRFDECAYSNLTGEVQDMTGNYPATPLNAVTTNTQGVLSNFLDETSNRHQVRTVGTVPIGNTWTASVWFKAPFVTTQRYHVLGSVDGGGDLMYLDRNSNFRWGVYTPGGGVKNGNFRFGTLNDGWHHLGLVGTNSGASGTTRLYIDGSFIEQVALQTKGDLKYLGTSFDGSNGSSAQGFGTGLDEFIVFDQVLTESEIVRIYNNQLSGLNYDGTSRAATTCSAVLDHFNINVGAGSASTCAPFAFSITAEDSSNNPVTDYTGSIDITTSTSHGNFAISSATNAISPNPDADDNGAASYLFDSADSGQIDLTLDNAHAETLTITVADSAASVSSTSVNVTFSENAFVIEDNDAQIAGSNVPVAGRDHAYRIRMVRQDSSTGVCATATEYNGAKNLKLWRSQNATDPSSSNPLLDGDSLPAADPGANNGAITFSAGVANVLLSTSDIGKYTLELADISNSFSDTTIAGTSAEQTIRPFGIGIDFSGMRAADFADNGAIDDSTGSNLSFAANSSGSVFTQAGENFSATVSGVLWQAADDSDDDGVPDSGAFLGNNTVAPSFGAEGESVTLSASLFAPAGATLGSLSGTLFNSFSAGTQTATMTYANVGIIDLAAALSDGDYFGSGVNLIGAATNVGRFNPYQYGLTSSLVNNACVAGSFTYARQPFTASATIEAQDKTGARTDGFRDTFATLDVTSELGFQNSETGSAFDLQTVTLTESFSAGTPGSVQFNLDLRYDMALQDKTVTLVQLTSSSDEVTTIAAAPVTLGSTEVRFGRLSLDNVYGSELIDLTMPMQTEYYNGSNFLVNTQDSCTTITTGDLNVVQALSGGSSTVSVVSSTAASGILNISLTAPGAGNYGDIDITADANGAGESWLQFDWDGDGTHDNNPAARATFGIYSGDSKQIYRRQIFQ